MRVTKRKMQENDAGLLDLTAALRRLETPVANDLVERLELCRDARLCRRGDVQTALRWAYRCRSPACWSCSRSLVRKKTRQAETRFQGRRNADCSLVTIVLGRVGDLGAMRDVLSTARKDIRNLRDSRGRISKRWRSVEFGGFTEVDAVDWADLHLLAPDRRKLIPSLPSWSVADGGGDQDRLWLPHMHLLVWHPLLDRAELRDALSNQWPGERRVNVVTFDPEKSPDANAHDIIDYSLKFSMMNKFGFDFSMQGTSSFNLQEPWPMYWKAEFFSWLHSSRRGLQPLQVTVNAQTDGWCEVDRILSLFTAHVPVLIS